jgi:hypothetical protein
VCFATAPATALGDVEGEIERTLGEAARQCGVGVDALDASEGRQCLDDGVDGRRVVVFFERIVGHGGRRRGTGGRAGIEEERDFHDVSAFRVLDRSARTRAGKKNLRASMILLDMRVDAQYLHPRCARRRGTSQLRWSGNATNSVCTVQRWFARVGIARAIERGVFSASGNPTLLEQ